MNRSTVMAMTMIDEGLLQETTNICWRKRDRRKREMGSNQTQTRVGCGIGFWDLDDFPSAKGAGEHHWLGRGKALRISRAPGRPRSITGRQGLEGVTPDDDVRRE